MQHATPNFRKTAAQSAWLWRAWGAAFAGWCVAVCAAAQPAIYLLGEVHDIFTFVNIPEEEMKEHVSDKIMESLGF